MQNELTTREKEILDAVEKHGTRFAAAQALGITERSLYRHLSVIKSKEHPIPVEETFSEVPIGHNIKGISYLKKDGEPRPLLTWVKTRQSDLDFEQFWTSLEKRTFRYPKIDPVKIQTDRLLATVYGDPHLGMLAWGKESGTDYNLDIACELHKKSFRYLVDKGQADTILIVILGDFLHSDNRKAVTEKSGHRLDVDSRYWKVVDRATELLCYMVEYAAANSSKVVLKYVPGNHDWHSQGHICRSLNFKYANTAHIEIDVEPTKQKYFRYGQTLIGICHSDTEKPNKLPQLMWTDRRQDAGQTTFHHWFYGHIHHKTAFEESDCLVESFGTLAAIDSHAYEYGYRSRRIAEGIVFAKKFGQIERHFISPTMIDELQSV